MRNGAVKIGVDVTTGEITYSDPAAHACKKQTIEWIGDDPFAIQFTGNTPVDFQRKRSRRKRASGQHKLTGVVKDKVKPGVYQYAVAVCANGKVYLDARCPVIIIDL